ncbi:MAG: O-antigen ligase family protein [Deltaproteobacteria bacterium]|nr:O-antigen ligase family protein [Deltaproteobacteria bacterium]
MSTAALVAALLVPLAAALGIGGVHPASHALLAALAIAALALLVIARAKQGAPLRVSWLTLPFVVSTAAGALLLVPLPHGLRSALSPDGAERALRAAELVGPEAAALVRPTLAFEPPEAALALVRGLGALAVLLVVTQVAGRAGPRRLAYRLLTGVGAVVFVVAAGHAVLGVGKVWGTFGGGAAPFHAPLVNENQLGRVFAFFALLALGRGLSIRRGPETAWHGVVGALCALAVILTNSRGAVLALAVGGVALAVLLASRRTADALPNAGKVLGALAAVAVIGGVALSTVGSSLVADLAALDPEGLEKSKLTIWRSAWELAREHAGVGIGPGAFGAVFPSSLEIGELRGSRFSYSHVENLVLQTVIDRGVPLACLLFALVAWACWRVASSGAAAMSPGAAAAVVALMVGELFDFVTDLPVGLVVLAVGVALIAARGRERVPCLALPPRRALATVAALVVVCGLALPVALADWRHRVDERLASLTGSARTAELVRAMARHPSDGQYAYEMAVAARHRRDPRAALHAAERALSLWPAHRGAHVETARALAALGRVEQAVLEYRVAWRCGWFDQELQDEILGRFQDWARRRAAVPDQADALAHLCGALVDAKHLDAQRCLDELANLDDAVPHQRGAHIRFALEHGDVEGAVLRAEAAMREDAPDGAAAAAASALATKDGVPAALARTESWPARLADAQPLLSWRVAAAGQMGDEGAVDAALAELRQRARTPAAIDDADRVVATVLERRGQAAEAHRIVERLAGRAPTDVELGVWQARLERTLGMSSQALVTARRLQRAWPDDARVRALLVELEPGRVAP